MQLTTTRRRRGGYPGRLEGIMPYQKIVNKLHEVGFDEFYQAGSASVFHPLNVVATSKITNKQYRICIDGGYRCPESFHISYRELGTARAKVTRIPCKNQSEIVEQLGTIQVEIKSLKLIAR